MLTAGTLAPDGSDETSATCKAAVVTGGAAGLERKARVSLESSENLSEGIRTRRRGEFVWAKVRKRPSWWPAKVVDVWGTTEAVVHVFGLAASGGFALRQVTEMRSFGEVFQSMTSQSSSPEFSSAVKDALGTLQEELDVDDFVAGRFLEQLSDVAVDVRSINSFEVAVLSCWAAAFRGWEGYSGCRMDGMEELVGLEKKEKEEHLFLGKGVMVKPDEVEESNGRKTRSVLELMGLSHLSKEEEPKKDERPRKLCCRPKKQTDAISKSTDLLNMALAVEETSGSSGRVRKRSRYLLPPYTDVTGSFSKRWLSERDLMKIDHHFADEMDPMQESVPEETESSLKETSMTSIGESDNDDSAMKNMLDELLRSAVDHFHPRWSHFDRTWDFFDRFRKSAYTLVPDEFVQQEVLHDVADDGMDCCSGCDVSSVRESEEQDEMEHVSAEQHHETDTQLSKKKDDDEVSGSREIKSVCKGGRDDNHAADKTVTGQNDEMKRQRVKGSSKSAANGSAPTLQSCKRVEPKSMSCVDVELPMNGDPGNVSAVSRLNKKWKNVDGADRDVMYALHMTFAEGSLLPSKPELESVFSRFGTLVASGTELLLDSHSARIVFMRAEDAMKASETLDSNSMIGTPVAKYELQMVPDNFNTTSLQSPTQSSTKKTPLPYIKRSLQRIISKLSDSTVPENINRSSKSLSPELKLNLKNDIEGILNKVNQFISEASDPAA